MPGAVCPVPRLVRMSLRTMPESASAFRFCLEACEPSAGYGPAVSWGISATMAVAVLAVLATVAAVAIADVGAGVAGAVVAVGALVLVAGAAVLITWLVVLATVPHPASSIPIPRAPIFRMRRRSIGLRVHIARSAWRPRSYRLCFCSRSCSLMIVPSLDRRRP